MRPQTSTIVRMKAFTTRTRFLICGILAFISAVATAQDSASQAWRTPSRSEVEELFKAVKFRTPTETSLEVTVEIRQSSNPSALEADAWARNEADEGVSELESLGVDWSQTDWEKLYQANHASWVQTHDGIQLFGLSFWSDGELRRWDEVEYPVSNDEDVKRILSEGMEPTPQHPLRSYVNLNDLKFSKWRSYHINRSMKVGTLSRYAGHQWGWTKRDYRIAGMMEPELAMGILLAVGNQSEFSQLDPDLDHRHLLTISINRRDELVSDSHPDFRLRIRKGSERNPSRIVFRLETLPPDQEKKQGVIETVRRRFSDRKTQAAHEAQGVSDFESTRESLMNDSPYFARFEYSFDHEDYTRLYHGSIETKEPKARYISVRRHFDKSGFPASWKVSREGAADQFETWTMRFKNVDLDPRIDREEIFAIPSPTEYTIEDITSGKGQPLTSMEDIRHAEAGKLPMDSKNRLPIWLGYLGILSLALGSVYRFWKR